MQLTTPMRLNTYLSYKHIDLRHCLDFCRCSCYHHLCACHCKKWQARFFVRVWRLYTPIWLARWLVILYWSASSSLRHIRYRNGHFVSPNTFSHRQYQSAHNFQHVRGSARAVNSSSQSHCWNRPPQSCCRLHFPCTLGLCPARPHGAAFSVPARTCHSSFCRWKPGRRLCTYHSPHYSGTLLWNWLHYRCITLHLGIR